MPFFLYPNKPVILTKNITKNDEIVEQKFFFYSTEEVQSKDSHFSHKFTIYFSELKSKVQNNFHSPTKLYNNYSIVIERYENEQNQAIYQSRLGFGDALSVRVPIDFIINPHGCGIGSIILNHLIFWAKLYYPVAPKPAIELSVVDEHDFNNAQRRDRLYTKIKLINAPEAEVINDLTPICNNRGFEVQDVYTYINNVIIKNENIILEKDNINSSQLSKIQDLEHRIAHYNSRINNPLKVILYWANEIILCSAYYCLKFFELGYVFSKDLWEKIINLLKNK